MRILAWDNEGVPNIFPPSPVTSVRCRTRLCDSALQLPGLFESHLMTSLLMATLFQEVPPSFRLWEWVFITQYHGKRGIWTSKRDGGGGREVTEIFVAFIVVYIELVTHMH